MMTTIELIDGLVKYTLAVVSPIAGFVIGWNTYQTNRTERMKVKAEGDKTLRKMEIDREVALAREASVGAEAIKDLVEKDKEIIEEMGEIERRFDDRDADTRKQLQSVTQQIQQFTLSAISLLSGNNLKK